MKRIAVELDFWENQRYSLRGWSTPYQTTGKVYPFSDISGKVSFNHDTVKNGSVFLPLGWEWCQSDWTIDFSGTYGEIDEEGWSYASSFETLFESSRSKQLQSERSSLNVVRRRRWIRGRKCVAQSERTKYLTRVDWIEGIRNRMEEVRTLAHADFIKLSAHNENQEQSIRKVVASSDQTLKEIVASLTKMKGQLVAMKAFLAERGAVESMYAKKMDSHALKWINLKSIQQRFFPTASTGYLSTSALIGTTVTAPTNAVDNGHLKQHQSSQRPQPPKRKSSFFSATPFTSMFMGDGGDNITEETSTSHHHQQQQQQQQQPGARASAPGGDVARSGSKVPVGGEAGLTEIDVNGDEEEDGTADDFVNSSSPPPSAHLMNSSSTPNKSFTADQQQPQPPAGGDVGRIATVTKDIDSYGVAAPGEEGSFFHVVSAANLAISKRLEDYARLLGESLPVDVGAIISEVEDALQDCRNEGNRMRTLINTRVKLARSSFETYYRCYEHSALVLALETDQLYHSIYHASAAEESHQYAPKGAAGSGGGGSVGSSSGSGSNGGTSGTDLIKSGYEVAAAVAGSIASSVEGSGSDTNPTAGAFTNLENIDLWLSIQLYSTEVTDIDSALLMYHAFGKLQWKKLQDLSSMVVELLRSVMKIFVHEQFRVWQDSSSMLEAVGITSDAVLVNAASDTESPTSQLERMHLQHQQQDQPQLQQQQQHQQPAGSSRSLTTNSAQEGQEVGGSNGAGTVVSSSDDKVSYTPGSVAAAVTAPDAQGQVQPKRRTSEASLLLDGSSGPDNIPSNSDVDILSTGFSSLFEHKAYIAYHGRLSYCTTLTSSGGAGDGSGTSGGGGGAGGGGGTRSREELTEHSMWDDALVVITYNRILHLLKPPTRNNASEDPLKFRKDRLILSMNTQGAHVAPVYIPKEGYRDAFEIVPAATAAAAKRRGSFMASLIGGSKEIASIVFITNDAVDVRNWMRIIGNPYADPGREPVPPPTYQTPVQPRKSQTQMQMEQSAAQATASLSNSGSYSGKGSPAQKKAGDDDGEVPIQENPQLMRPIKPIVPVAMDDAQIDEVITGENPQHKASWI